ncbi:MAG: 5-histidylcysteine sulfoxide synthase [Arcobacteraceae bacterium]|nr:5-histidylcysteine sulfoxide synthase [Arcobacteraceae bacterium]
MLEQKNIILNGNSIEQKREEITQYFLKTYESFEKLFELFVNDNVFYEQPEPLRHKLIFYFGHTAVFYINKLILAQELSNRIDPELESIFGIGVDEMSWDDLQNIKFPTVEKTKEYREKVKKCIIEYIQTVKFTLPITWESPMWIILMGIEHENIHFETSSVLHRQLDINLIKDSSYFPICKQSGTSPINELLKITGDTITLGKSHESDDFYGWDNEYGKSTVLIEDFEASKYLVSNSEYLEFVNNNGYTTNRFWDKEGIEWKNQNNITHPPFWIKEPNGYKYRTLAKIIEMPQNWPVEVNCLEAEAFCRYKSEKLSKKITLPTEAQYYRLREACNLPNEVTANANINHQYSSSTPIDMFQQGDFYDVVGNVWQWSSTPIDAFEDFKVHPIYDDFSVPTFDGEHNLIKGGSWASKGNEILKSARYAFRKHFYQHAGFRYVHTTQDINEDIEYYESDEIVAQYCEFHYGQEYLGVKNFPKTIAELAKKYSTDTTKKVLDLGCSVGRCSFELKKYFPSVTGIDFSTRFIKVAIDLQEKKHINYKQKIEGDITKDKTVTLVDLELDNLDMDGLEFWQGDACNLKPNFDSYDMIVAINLLDRLYDSRKFLNDITEKLNPNGILIIASPFTWSEEYVSKKEWLGGKIENNTPIYSQDILNKILLENFIAVEEPFEVEFVIQEHCRKYQHTFSLCSIWKKK